MARTSTGGSTDHPNLHSRGHFLRQVGLGAAGVTLGAALPRLGDPGTAHAAVSFASGTLNVSYWSTVTPKKTFLDLLNRFATQHGLRVVFNPEPAAFGDYVQKYTTYLSSGYTGLDAMWIDDFSVATWGTAGWLEPLEARVPHASVAAVLPASIKASTYNGHLYRLPANLAVVIFFYRKDLFAKSGLSVPRTWQDVVRAGQKLTTGGRYGIGMAGKNGETQLFNELAYYIGQSGGSLLQLKTPAARKGLQFMYDLIHTYKIAPPDTVTADYTSLQASFEDGRIAMWPVWDGFYGAFQATPKLAGKIAIGLPPRGPANNHTISGYWGWAISKYSKNKDIAAKFIEFASSEQSEAILAQTGSTPGRVAALSDPAVTRILKQAPYLVEYAKANLPRARPLTAQTQRISDAIEAVINQYLNKQLSLDAAISQAQARIDQIQGNG